VREKHFDFHFVAFAAYSVKDIAELNHWDGAIVSATWHLCICFNVVITAHFWIFTSASYFSYCLHFVLFHYNFLWIKRKPS